MCAIFLIKYLLNIVRNTYIYINTGKVERYRRSGNKLLPAGSKLVTEFRKPATNQNSGMSRKVLTARTSTLF